MNKMIALVYDGGLVQGDSLYKNSMGIDLHKTENIINVSQLLN